MRVLLFLALIYPAMASAESGNDLLASCEGKMATFSEGLCIGYIEGITDTHASFFIGWGDLTEPAYCIPQGVKLGQVLAIVIKYLKENPEELHLRASGLVLKALHDAFTPEIKFENGEPVFYCP